MKPGYAGQPLPGISIDILTEDGRPSETGGGLLSITEPWPSMTRGVWGIQIVLLKPTGLNLIVIFLAMARLKTTMAILWYWDAWMMF